MSAWAVSAAGAAGVASLVPAAPWLPFDPPTSTRAPTRRPPPLELLLAAHLNLSSYSPCSPCKRAPPPSLRNLQAGEHATDRRQRSWIAGDATQAPRTCRPTCHPPDALRPPHAPLPLPFRSAFAFPGLDKPIGISRGVPVVPKNRPFWRFDGNTARSSGWWWSQAGCICECRRLAVAGAWPMVAHPYRPQAFIRLLAHSHACSPRWLTTTPLLVPQCRLNRPRRVPRRLGRQPFLHVAQLHRAAIQPWPRQPRARPAV